jgi:soluble lytic murein transglycosylase-like protein
MADETNPYLMQQAPIQGTPSIPMPNGTVAFGKGLTEIQQQLTQAMLQQKQDRETKLKERFNYSKELNDADGMISTAREMYGQLTPDQEQMIRQHAQQQNLLSAAKGFEESKFLPIQPRYQYLSQLGYGEFLPKTRKEEPDYAAFQKQLEDAGLITQPKQPTGMGLGLMGMDPIIDNIQKPLVAEQKAINDALSGYNVTSQDRTVLAQYQQVLSGRQELVNRLNYAVANAKLTGDYTEVQSTLQQLQQGDAIVSQLRDRFTNTLSPGTRSTLANNLMAYRQGMLEQGQARIGQGDIRLGQGQERLDLARQQLQANREQYINKFAFDVAKMALETRRINNEQANRLQARILNLYNGKLARDARLASAYLLSPEEYRQIERQAMADAKAQAMSELNIPDNLPMPEIQWQSFGGGLSAAPVGTVPVGVAPVDVAPTTQPAAPSLDRTSLSENLRRLGVNEAYLNNLSRKYNVPVDEILAVIQQESGGDPNATSKSGARGLMQLMPQTFQGLGVRGDITNPRVNVEAGVKYLAEMHRRFPNRLEAIGHYNAGPGGNLANPETQGYMRNIGGRLGLSAGSPAAVPTLGLDPATSSVRANDAGRTALLGGMGAAPAARRRATDAGTNALLNGVR